MINDKTNDVLKNFLNHFWTDIKLDGKPQWEVVILSLIVLIYWFLNLIKQILNKADHI